MHALVDHVPTRQPTRLPRGSEPLPAQLTDMADEVPACFERKAWVMWLSDTWHKPLDNDAEHDAMTLGVVPDFCVDCTLAHRAAMTRVGRCERAAGLLEKTPCKSR